jgi:hypothetical protein
MRPSTLLPTSDLKLEQSLKYQEVQRPQRRRVHFNKVDESERTGDVEVCDIPPNMAASDLLSDEQKPLIWWQKADLDLFGARTELLAEEFIRRGENHDPKGFTKVFLTSHLSCSHVDGPNAEQRHYSKQWVKAASSLRGIEHLCIAQLAKIKADAKCKTIRAVLEAQACCSKANTMSRDQTVEFIKSVSECRSLGARNFARLLGECDAYAVAPQDEVFFHQQQPKQKTVATTQPPVVVQGKEAHPNEGKSLTRTKDEKYATSQFVKDRKSYWWERPRMLAYRRAKIETNSDYS